jgi:hypothetical protein
VHRRAHNLAVMAAELEACSRAGDVASDTVIIKTGGKRESYPNAEATKAGVGCEAGEF